MQRGCTDNKLNDNESLNKDKLSLDAMKGLSIDEITSLYKQGYVLEGTESNIESMQYNQCTGSIDVDINWSAISQQGGSYLYKESAKAIKINPTSRCLDFITFFGVRKIANVSIYVEIRSDNGTGNSPLGTPGSSTGQLAQVLVPHGNIPATFGTFNVDFALLLPSVGTYWIVMRSTDYSCANAATQRLELSQRWPGLRYMVYGYSEAFCAPVGCCWYLLSTDTIPIATYKKTYSPPVLTTISVTPTTASVNVGATTQLTATCADTNGAPMTCPTLAWASSNPSIVSVNPSTGLATGVTAGGPINITASSGTVTSNVSAITVNVPSQVLGSIIISPASQSINTGGIVQLTAVCKDTSDAPMTCPTLAWASSNPSIVSVNPSTGLATGVTAGGPINITASVGTVTSNISAITVTGIVSTLTSIVVSPASASIGIGGTRQLTAVCKDTGGATMTCPILTWVSSLPAKATVSSTGLVTGVVEGITNVTASAGAVTSNASVITVMTTPPQAGGGGVIVIAAVALIAAAMFMARKPPTPPT